MPAWRSIASARSSAFFLLVAVLAAPLCPRIAVAQRVRVAVLAVEGPQGDKATREIIKAVKKDADLVPESDWNNAAKKLFATSHSASDLAAVAGDLAIAVVVTGKVKKTEAGWELSVSVRHGPTGKSASKFKYPLRGPRIDAATLRKLGEDVAPAIDPAAAGPAQSETPETPETTPSPDETGSPPTDESENPLDARNKKSDEPSAGRPAWAPWFEASAGFVLAGRSFGFDEPSTPSFHASITGGLQLDGTAFPLAFLAGGKASPASGLGVGATYAVDFWPDSTPCYADVSGNCLPTVDHYATNEWRFEAGLRYRWSIFRGADNRPELLANAQYGRHLFAVQKRSYLAEGGPRDIGPPDVDYSYVTLGAGLRLPFAKRFAAFFLLNFHILLDTGSIQTPAEWGPGGGYGLRVNAGLEFRIWQGLFARAAGHVEHFGLSFNPPGMHRTMPPCPCGTTGAASDNFYGGVLSVGYAY